MESAPKRAWYDLIVTTLRTGRRPKHGRFQFAFGEIGAKTQALTVDERGPDADTVALSMLRMALSCGSLGMRNADGGRAEREGAEPAQVPNPESYMVCSSFPGKVLLERGSCLPQQRTEHRGDCDPVLREHRERRCEDGKRHPENEEDAVPGEVEGKRTGEAGC